MTTHSRRPWEDIPVPARIKRIPSMLFDEEMQYLIWLTAERYEGWGSIVDLGPWLGASSAALADGLLRWNPTTQAKVVSIDSFKWVRAYMEQHSPENLTDGADFSDVFRREVGEYLPWTEARKHDLQHYRWDGGPIEILFVDAAKSWELTNAILAGFGGALVPGRTRVLLQDFRHHDTHWLPLIFDSRADLWREVESTAHGMTVTFVPQKTVLGHDGIHPGYSDAFFPFATAEALLRARIEGAETPWQRGCFLRTLYRRCLVDGQPATAAELRRELLADATSAPDEEELAGLGDISDLLLPRGWDAYTRGDFAEAASLGERCIAGGVRSVYAIDLIAAVDLARGDLAAAERHLSEAVALDPDLASVWTRLSQVRMGQRRFREAEDCVRRALQRGRGDELQVHYALCSLEQIETLGGDSRRFAKVLASVREHLAASPNYWVASARVESHEGRHEAARRSLERALALARDHPGARALEELWAPPRTLAAGPP